MKARLDRLLARKSRLPIIISLPRNDAELARAAFDCGADAVKVHLNVHHHASGTRFGGWPEEKKRIAEVLAAARGPVGLMPGAAITPTREELLQALDAGIEFIDIYDFDMPAWMLTLPAGRMIAAGHGFSLESIKAFETMGMDYLEASILHRSQYGRPLTASDLAQYRLISRATRKPVLVPSQKKIEPHDLPLLEQAGVRGVILGAVVLGKTAASLARELSRFTHA